MNTHMKAICIDAPGSISLTRRAIPAPGPGEVRVRLLYVGYCGSDLGSFQGRNPLVNFPRVPGHELSGIIDDIGDDVPASLGVGQRVTILPYFNCGTCFACRKNRPNACRNNQTMGVQREGALAEYTCVPHNHIIPVNTLSPRDTALIEPLAVGFHAVERARIEPGETVAVLGVGMIGLGIVLAALRKGAHVIAVDLSAQKLEIARQLGAVNMVNAATENVVDRLLALTNGDGPSVILEAAGSPHTFRQAVDAASQCARVVYVGYTKVPVEYETRLFVSKEIEILGSRGATRDDFKHVTRYLEDNPACADIIISKIVPIDTADAAMREWAAAPGAITKILIRFGDYQPENGDEK
ncbi:zinc-binding alcohol dehydrogenase family protein [Thalassospira mesophila]|uniref:zinc-binding alcohol dehydrogenase family protein n=1 Tax=Thalassospira mesophila TaxID=1293891 RepID=UPI001FE6F028|nr:zinc-binding alcohol dehydrogenase family protein [Thalassospira mesophila]